MEKLPKIKTQHQRYESVLKIAQSECSSSTQLNRSTTQHRNATRSMLYKSVQSLPNASELLMQQIR